MSGRQAPLAATLLVLETRQPPRAWEERPATDGGGANFVHDPHYLKGAAAPLANTVSPRVDRPWHTNCGPHQSQRAEGTSRQAVGDAPERDHRTIRPIVLTALR